MFQFIIHYSLHFIAPGILAKIFFKEQWIKSWLIMLSTMVIDLDHLFANPIYDASRCGIGFHPLHSMLAMGLYIFLLIFPRTRIIAVGLIFHIFTDSIDCLI